MTASALRTAALAALVLSLFAVSPAGAQSADGADRIRRVMGSLGDSARVRLLAPGVVVDDGLFLGLRRDSVLVGDADARFAVGLAEIEGLSVESSRWMSVGAQAGAVTLVAGAAAGFFLGYFHCGDLVQECGGHAQNVALRWGLGLGAVGTVAGAIAGSRLRQWRRVFP